jgi:hypothetical protein
MSADPVAWPRPVRTPGARHRAGGAAWSDVALLAFLLAVHAMPLVALAAGRSWGAVAEGCATVVVLVAGAELVRELRDHLRAPGVLEERPR